MYPNMRMKLEKTPKKPPLAGMELSAARSAAAQRSAAVRRAKSIPKVSVKIRKQDYDVLQGIAAGKSLTIADALHEAVACYARENGVAVPACV